MLKTQKEDFQTFHSQITNTEAELENESRERLKAMQVAESYRLQCEKL